MRPIGASGAPCRSQPMQLWLARDDCFRFADVDLAVRSTRHEQFRSGKRLRRASGSGRALASETAAATKKSARRGGRFEIETD